MLVGAENHLGADHGKVPRDVVDLHRQVPATALILHKVCIYALISFTKSTPPQKRQLTLYYYELKY